jgi:hypothetical protein
VYDRENIEKRLDEKIQEIVDLLGISKDEAVATLRYFKWDMDKIQNAWFDGGKKLRTKIGLDFDDTLTKSKP